MRTWPTSRHLWCEKKVVWGLAKREGGGRMGGWGFISLTCFVLGGW